MRARNLLHRTKLDEFKQWLESHGHRLQEPKGDYEVLRWKGKKGKPMPMVFDRHEGDHLTTNATATGYVRQWVNSRTEVQT
jgi:hypothetical protein